MIKIQVLFPAPIACAFSSFLHLFISLLILYSGPSTRIFLGLRKIFRALCR